MEEYSYDIIDKVDLTLNKYLKRTRKTEKRRTVSGLDSTMMEKIIESDVPDTSMPLSNEDTTKSSVDLLADYLFNSSTWKEGIKNDIKSTIPDFPTDIMYPITATWHKVGNVTYMWVILSVGGAVPIGLIIYWSGTAMRAFLPLTGNSINLQTKLPIGFNDEKSCSEDREFIYSEILEVPIKDVPDIELDDDIYLSIIDNVKASRDLGEKEFAMNIIEAIKLDKQTKDLLNGKGI